jgi:proline iminopeptidase
MNNLYPEIAPFQSFFLETGSRHAVYVEQSGNPDGIPVIFLHGGPCSGTKPDHRRFFNTEFYRIILFDQRGSGLSLPFGELEHNSTQDLIDDMERIRLDLNINQWLLFGGSWGGALALLYAQQHGDKVMGMIIRGVFLARQQDLDWFIKGGAGLIYPELWRELLASVPEQASENVLYGLCAALWSDDEVAHKRVTKAWMDWGGQVALGNDYQSGAIGEISEQMVKQVRMEMHYARNRYFIKENQILENCERLQTIPTVIIHGRYDLVCPVEAGMRLAEALPGADYIVLPNAGHVAKGDEMIDALVSATDRFAAELAP